MTPICTFSIDMGKKNRIQSDGGTQCFTAIQCLLLHVFFKVTSILKLKIFVNLLVRHTKHCTDEFRQIQRYNSVVIITSAYQKFRSHFTKNPGSKRKPEFRYGSQRWLTSEILFCDIFHGLHYLVLS